MPTRIGLVSMYLAIRQWRERAKLHGQLAAMSDLEPRDGGIPRLLPRSDAARWFFEEWRPEWYSVETSRPDRR